MARRIRVEYAGATYHVTTRGNRRAAVFRRPEDFDAYLEDLEALSASHGIEVHAFCLMTNHVHLAVRTTEEGRPLSVFMQQLNLRHARRYNWTNRVRGHLNESRYRSQLVGTHEYLLTLVRYIHQNPVVARMVSRPEDWRYSSHRAYLGRGYGWVKTDEVLWRSGGRSGYVAGMRKRLTREDRRSFEPDARGRMPCLAGFRAMQDLGRRQVNPWVARPPAKKVEEAVLEVAAGLGLDVATVVSGGQRAAMRAGRREIAEALRGRGYRLYEIGRVLGREEAAISRLLARAEGCRENAAGYGLAA